MGRDKPSHRRPIPGGTTTEPERSIEMPSNRHLIRLATGLLAVAAVAVALAAAGSGAIPVYGSQSVGLTAGVDSRAPGSAGEVFYTATVAHVLSYGEPIRLAGSRDATAKTLVAGELTLTVRRADGTEATFQHDYCNGTSTSLQPTDVTRLFSTGDNTVTLTLRQSCSNEEGSGPIWLVAPPVL
jgi:hypothetical protein